MKSRAPGRAFAVGGLVFTMAIASASVGVAADKQKPPAKAAGASLDSAHGNSAARTDDAFHRAVELRIAGNYDEALAILKKVAEENAVNHEVSNEAIYQRGLVLEDARRYSESLVAYELAFNRAPGTSSAPFALLGWARVQSKMGKIDDAVEAYGQVLRTYPRLGSMALLGRAMIEERAGRPLDALRTYRMLRRNFPRSGEAVDADRAIVPICDDLLKTALSTSSFEETMARGECLMDRGSHQEVEDLYKKALKGRQSAVVRMDYYMALGAAYEAADKPGQAKRTYRRAEKIMPRTAQAAAARMSIVQIYFDRNRFSDAVRELKRIVKKYPHTEQAAHAQYMIGSCFESLRDRKRSEEAYRKVVEMAPQSTWAFESQQRLMRLMGRGR